MRYALIIAGYALVLWGILTVRREAGQGRAASYRDGRAEIEAVVEEFVAAAERVRADLERKSVELQRLINLADDRLAKLIQAQTPTARTPEPAADARTTLAHEAQVTKEAAKAPPMPSRGMAAAAASYRVQAGDQGGATVDQSDKAPEVAPEESKPDHATGRAETGDKKSRKDRSRHAEVYRLADAGQGVTEIARVTGLSKGEVQLMLDLRKTR